MTAEKKARELLRQHGLVFKAKNPIEHVGFEPECGSCHHIDVICLQYGIASALKDTEREAYERAAKLVESDFQLILFRDFRAKSFQATAIRNLSSQVREGK